VFHEVFVFLYSQSPEESPANPDKPEISVDRCECAWYVPCGVTALPSKTHTTANIDATCLIY